MGYKGLITGHGFRGLASTILHERGCVHEHIELQLAHAPRNAVSAAYSHALYLGPRAKMMQEWADFLEQTQRGAKVLEFRGMSAERSALAGFGGETIAVSIRRISINRLDVSLFESLFPAVCEPTDDLEVAAFVMTIGIDAVQRAAKVFLTGRGSFPLCVGVIRWRQSFHAQLPVPKLAMKTFIDCWPGAKDSAPSRRAP